MFLLKKIVPHFLYPLPLAVFILAIGVVLLWCTRRQKTGKALVSAGTLFLLVLSYDPLPSMLVEHLEKQFVPLAAHVHQHPTSVDDLAVKRIVVLGGGHVADPRLPATGQLSANALARVVEGVRLYKKMSQGTLILSGGLKHGGVLHGAVMAAAAQELGVPAQDIRIGKPARDTRGEAAMFRTLMGREPFVLVTSASHMPRAVALFTKLGMRPIPAPSDYVAKQTKGEQRLRVDAFFPTPSHLDNATRALHEYLGLLWAKIRGQV